MKKVSVRFWIAMVLLVGGSALAVERGVPLDAGFRDTSDGKVWLSSYRGKPTVVIYEDRHSTEVNRRFKEALRQRAQSPELASAVHLVGVASVSGFNFFPVRGFALNGVRDAERKGHWPLLVDWEGTLARPPWSLPRDASSVLVLDPEGEVLFAASGALTPDQEDQVFSLLARLVVRGQVSPPPKTSRR